jgi:hypothetical protein
MSTDLNALFSAMNRGDVFAITDQLFPRTAVSSAIPEAIGPQQLMCRCPDLEERPASSSPATPTAGTAGVGVSSEIQRMNELVAHYRRKDGEHERLIAKLLKLLNQDDLDGARDLVKEEYDSIHGPRE